MKGLVLYQPWAYFTMPTDRDQPARKRLETRAMPIGGLDGATGPALPGCHARTGERVAILAGADPTAHRHVRAGGGHGDVTAEQETAMVATLDADGICCENELAWGSVIGTVQLGAAFMMTDYEGTTDHEQPHLLVGTRHDPERLLLCLPGEGHYGGGAVEGAYFQWDTTVVTDQRPYGVWAPGRWAIELDDPVALRQPVPIRGRQGLHHLRDTTELERVVCPRCHEGPMLTTAHEAEHDWCPRCGWVDE